MLEEILSSSIQKRVGQLFFIGLPGPEINVETRNLIEHISPGGICLFARNIRTPSQTRRLLDEVREILPFKPFISIDQEGGLVDRLRRIITPMPYPNSIKTVEEAKQLAKITAEVLLMLGFNMNFAPVVDVIGEERKKFTNGLYSRSFGTYKEEVALLTGAYLDTLQKNGCLGCIKHFPGLGASETDSHEDLPLIELSREELFSHELFPYQKLFQTSHVEVVMVAHAAFPLIDLQETTHDGKLLPTSLSYNFVTRLLRDELGFEGLVKTDDLEMGAILKDYGIGEACKLAIKAGEDMLSICASPDAVREGYEAVLNAVKKGEITETRINDSLRRIAKLKSKIRKSLPLDDERLQILSQNIAELNKQVNYSYGG